MKKSIKILLLFAVCIISLTGCGKEGNNSGGGLFSKSLKASNMNIKNFEYNTESTKCNGYDCYSMSLTNNSKYDIVAVEFTYVVKSSATEEQLSVYSDFMKDHDGYIEEDDSPKDVILRGNVERLISKGETMNGLHFTVGFKTWSWYDYPTEEQFNLMEPKEMQLGVIGEDKKLYIAYYDFKKDSWKLDEKTVVADTWTKKELSKNLIQPTSKHFIVREDEDDEYSIYAYGVTEENYKKYVEDLKNSGYEQDDSYTGHFEGKNKDGQEIEVWYYDDDQRMSISIEKGE